MEVINKSRDFNMVEKYLLTAGNQNTSIKDVPDNTSIPVDGWMIWSDDNPKTHQPQELLSIITPDKHVYVTNSKTFKDSLMNIHDCMEGNPYSIIKISGVSKNGKDYVNCDLDIDSVNL